MTRNLASMVTEAFCLGKQDSSIKLCKETQNEVFLAGNGFGLLIWLDRDGLIMWYLNTDSSAPEMIDIGKYLLIQRKWYVDETVPLDGSQQANNLRVLRSFAKTLREVGKDILAGDKAWLKTVSRPPSTMNAIEYEELRAVAASAHSSKNPSTGS